MNLPTLVKIAASTKITWDDLIAKKLQAIVNDPVAFEIIYRAITDVNTTPIETETVKQTLRERIKARLGYTLSESVYVEAADEIIPLINAIKNIKQLARA
jgi:cystathionine beta-lyase family protein involved in aluminum resistance